MSKEEKEKYIGASVERETDGAVCTIRDIWGNDAVIVWPSLCFSLIAIVDLQDTEQVNELS